MASNPSSLVVFMAVAAVAVVGLAFSSFYSSGAVVSISPGPVFEEMTPHVIGSSKMLRCVSDAYCPLDQSCVNKVCMDTRVAVSRGLVLQKSRTSDPSPDYSLYDQGGTPLRSWGERNIDDPTYAYEDFSRAVVRGTEPAPTYPSLPY